MSTITTTIIAMVMSISLPMTPVAFHVSESGWYPEPGDRIAVDTLNNEAYLMHKDGRYIRFPVVTGQRRYVSYIGRYYHAATRNWDWQAKSLHIKWDKVTFGPSGRFLRLYKDGETHTAYGFHEYRTDSEMFEDADGNLLPAEERFKSMGCIILTAEKMDLIVQTWETNGEVLDVKTIHGIESIQEVMLAFDAQNTPEVIASK